ncbi:MAG TPA: enoyl-CoA hydratase/isomerase family protein [Dehalococcoidia bacterium]|nr:enoyl-CoA hydratase/isomerase family protein [Dehalococcoidia bacterium]
MQKFETILYERRGRICYITLNRPEILNAVNDQLGYEVNEAYHAFDTDPEAWVAILSGAGRAFCSGADVRQRQLRPREELERMGSPAGRGARESALGQMVNWKPVIAAVHGYAYGAGYALAVDCDLIVAAEGTKFQITEVVRGLGAPQHWVSAWFWSGSRLANEMALTGRAVPAEEMIQHGMVNRVVPRDQLMQAAEELAEAILANPPLGVRANARMMRHYVREMQDRARMYGDALRLHLTEDFRESASAFIEKRKPTYQGR